LVGRFLLHTDRVKTTANAIYLGLMILAIIGVDILFFRNHTMGRLVANVGIVLLFTAFYYRFLKN
jgi:hypothetical protein